MSEEGGCQCGAVRYRIDPGPSTLYVCHCAECRKQSASAFGISVQVERAALTLLSGSPAVWTRPTDSGTTLDCRFCPTCGSRVWHEYGPDSPRITVKGGSLDDPPDIGRAIHIWTKRKLAGVVIPEGAQQFPAEPA